MTTTQKILYVAACVVVPVAWGLMMYVVSNKVDALLARWRGKPGDAVTPASPPAARNEPPPIEYQI